MPPTELKGGILLEAQAAAPAATAARESVSCFYSSGKLKTKFATDGEPLVLNFSNVKFHVAARTASRTAAKVAGADHQR